MTTESTKYNGWTNRETWLVNLHELVDDDTLTAMLLDRAEVDDRMNVTVDAGYLANDLKEYVENLLDDLGETPTNPFVADVFAGAMARVDWYELARNYIYGNVPSFTDLVEAGKVHPGDFDTDWILEDLTPDH